MYYKKILLLLCISFPLLGQAGWDGNAASGYREDFPSSGYWGLSNAFVPDTIVKVTNLENNRQLQVTILGRKEDRNLFLVLSPSAAQELGITQRATRVRVNPLSGGEVFNTFNETPLHPDVDINPTAVPPAPTTPPAPHTLITPTTKDTKENKDIPPTARDSTITSPPASHERVEVSQLQLASRRRSITPTPVPAPRPEPIPEPIPAPPIIEAPEPVIPEPPAAIPEPSITELAEPQSEPLPEPTVESTVEPPAPSISENPTTNEEIDELLKPELHQDTAPVDTRSVHLQPTDLRPSVPFALPQKSTKDIEPDSRYIQVGAFQDEESAKQLALQIKARGLDIFSYSHTITSGNISRVLIGPVSNDEYGSLLRWLRGQGFTDAFSRYGRELI